METNEFAKLTATCAPYWRKYLIWRRTETMQRHDAHLEFRLLVQAEDSLLLSYHQYNMCFHSDVSFLSLSFSLSLRHIFNISAFNMSHSHSDLGAELFLYLAVLAQPGWRLFDSLRQTLAAQGAPLKRPFFFLVSLESVKGSRLCLEAELRQRVQSPKPTHVKRLRQNKS